MKRCSHSIIQKCLKSHLYRFKRSLNSIIVWYHLILNYCTQTLAHNTQRDRGKNASNASKVEEKKRVTSASIVCFFRVSSSGIYLPKQKRLNALIAFSTKCTRTHRLKYRLWLFLFIRIPLVVGWWNYVADLDWCNTRTYYLHRSGVSFFLLLLSLIFLFAMWQM